jgi:hypothetical protein
VPGLTRSSEVNVKPAQRTPLIQWVLIGLIVAACSAREVPATWPDASPAAPAALAPPAAPVTRALEADPPLPGESTDGWAGLSTEGTPDDPKRHPGHGGGASSAGSPGAQPRGDDSAEHGHREDAVVYTCPMHPDVVSDRPGKCPRCGMLLVERDAPK